MESHTFNFSTALNVLKNGGKVARINWNGKGMFAYYVPKAEYPAMTEVGKEIASLGNGETVPYRAYLALKTVDNDVACWQPSVSDILADDWCVIL